MANTIKVSVLGEVRDINQKLGQVNKSLGTVGKVAKVAGGVMAAAFAGGAVVNAVKSVVTAASDAQQSIGATQTVFGKFSQSVIRDSNKAATQFGLDASTYRENANLLGSLFSNQGVAASKLAGSTKEMISVGADLAATFGGTTTDAVGALGAAFKGEFDSLEKYGISLKESTISAELAARGQDKLTGAALAAAKQQVTADLIMKQSAKTRGAFAKESDTLAHKQQVFAAQVENLKAKIGSALLPILTKFVGFLSSSVLPKLTEWYRVFKDKIVPVLKEVGDWIANNVLPPLQTLGTFLTNNKTVVATFAGVIGTIVVAMKIWTAVQAAFNAVMALNPIALVVIALAALAAALVYAYKKSETFRNIVNGAFNGIKAVVAAVMPVIKNIIQTVWSGIKSYIQGVLNVIRGIIKVVTSAIKGDWKGVWDGIKQILSGAWQAIKGIATAATAVLKSVLSAAWDAIKGRVIAAWDGIKNAVSNAIGRLVELARGIKGKFLGALSGAGEWLTDVGKNIVEGLGRGIESMYDWVRQKVEALSGWIPGWVKKRLGIASPSRVMKALGRFISQGLGAGITEGAPAVTDAMKSVTDKITEYYDRKIKKDAKAAKAAKTAIKSLSDESKALKTHAESTRVNNASLQEAKKALEDATKARDDYAASVRNNMVAFASITGVLDNSDPVNATAANLIGGLETKVKQAQEFAALIQQLTAQGLNSTNLDQLIQGGVDAGLSTARALVQGGPQAVAQVNSLTAQLQAVATNMGNSTAETMHGAGVQAAQGLVNGFESMADKLERAGNRLARKMVKAIKKALDINSPSRVFKKIGKQTTAGLVVGLRDTAGVERATFNIGKAMETSFRQPDLHASASLGSKTGGDVININVTAPATVDKAALGREIASSLDSYYKSGGRRLAI